MVELEEDRSVSAQSGRLSHSASIASMSDALDTIIHLEHQDGGGGGGALRTDRTGLSTARKRLSKMVVAQSIRAARLHVVKRILLPADDVDEGGKNSM